MIPGSIQDIVNYYLSKDGVQNMNTPAANNYGNTRQSILNNFVSPNQYNTGSNLNSSYPYMPSVDPMLGMLNTIAPNVANQSYNPIGQLMQLHNSSVGSNGPGVPVGNNNLGMGLLLANQQKQAANPWTPVSDNSAPATPPPTPQPTGYRTPTVQDLSNYMANLPHGKDLAHAQTIWNTVSPSSQTSTPGWMQLPKAILDELPSIGMQSQIPIYS